MFQDHEEQEEGLESRPGLHVEVAGFQLLELIGQGGHAEVFRAARHVAESHHQEVCLKRLFPHLRRNPASVAYFRREAGIAADLRHPNIVSLVEAKLAQHVIAYELVDGADLRRVLTAAFEQKLSVEHTVFIAIELCQALMYAHGRTHAGAPAAIVHRDLSARNVLISHRGDVKLGDFGVAWDVGEPQTCARGTQPYMSPEQARGEVLDGRSDLFALGVLMFEMLTGGYPFGADSDRRVVPDLRLRAPNAPPMLLDVVTKLLQYERVERFATAEDCFRALCAFAPAPVCKLELGELAARAHRRTTKDYKRMAEVLALKRRDGGAPPSLGKQITARLPTSVDVEAELQTEEMPPAQELLRSLRRPRRARTLGLLSAALALAAVFMAFFELEPTRGEREAGAAGERTSSDRDEMRQSGALSAERALTARVPAQIMQAPPVVSPTVSSAALPNTAADAREQGDERAVGDGAVEGQERGTAAGTEAMAARAAGGLLTIGADPPAKVWIDRRAYGWSPIVRAPLSAGKHVVQVGEGPTQVTRTVTVRAKGTHREYFDLASSTK